MRRFPLDKAIEIMKRRKEHLAERVATADDPSQMTFDRDELRAIVTLLYEVEGDKDGDNSVSTRRNLGQRTR